ncbi:MAG: hypothetical protein M3Y55_07300 [Pseudomonadota bacterium]|nr:hypothetical protein [Pseudomonadota bacterium]
MVLGVNTARSAVVKGGRVNVAKLRALSDRFCAADNEVGSLSGSAEWREGKAMKRSRFSEQQSAYALLRAESGGAVVDVCRPIGASRGKSRHSIWLGMRGAGIDRPFLRAVLLKRPIR